MTRRLIRLFVGLALYGFTMAMMVESTLGLDPWDVFHQGVAKHVPLTFGQVVIATGAIVMLLWIPLRQVPGFGTIANIVVIGLAADAGLAVLPTPDALVPRIVLLVGGVVGNGLAGALYIGAYLGPGPRDGLWLGLVRRTGHSIRMWRTLLEVTVVVIGFLLGGTVGAGTVLYALTIGPLVQFFLQTFPPPRTPPTPADESLVPADESLVSAQESVVLPEESLVTGEEPVARLDGLAVEHGSGPSRDGAFRPGGNE